MARNTGLPPPTPPQSVSISSIASAVRAYSLPLILLSASIFFQLFVLPRSFPTSHYDVLGIKRLSSIEEVTQAYEQLASRWSSGAEAPESIDVIKARYAFELLSNDIWKRDYDVFGIDEQQHVIEKTKELYAGASYSDIPFPLMEPSSFDRENHVWDVINSENFLYKFETEKPLLLQVFSDGSNRCANFSNHWKRIVALLDGVAITGMVDVGDVHLASYLAEKKSSGQPFFRDGLPALLAFPPGCNSPRCMYRYGGDLSVDAVTDWIATVILKLPRILYYPKESFGQNFLAKSKPHKVKVILFSRTGERARPFIRQAAKIYWTYASFAFILWQEDDSSIWWNTFGVESAPAVVFLKDPGVKPVVYHGVLNNSMFIDMVEKNKYQVLPQLRSVTSMELGCDPRGYSRAGKDTKIWYCAIVAGRLSQELNKMRETMRRVQETLSGDVNSHNEDSLSVTAALAVKQKRLTFTWLDGEAQKKYCFFHINSEDSYESCGPQRGITDTPRLLLVRYERNATTDDIEVEREPKTMLEALKYVAPDPASQLVAKYNGSSDMLEIMRWISETIKDGDSRNLPPFRTKSPELVPEDADPFLSTASGNIASSSKDLKQRIGDLTQKIYDQFGDPRIGPFLLLVALMSFGRIWLQRSRSDQGKDSKSTTQPINSEEASQDGKNRRRPLRNQLVPPSMTDVAPKDAKQVEFSDSDSD